eukprot:1669733-Prymnesium_polylepis.1
MMWQSVHCGAAVHWCAAPHPVLAAAAAPATAARPGYGGVNTPARFHMWFHIPSPSPPPPRPRALAHSRAGFEY